MRFLTYASKPVWAAVVVLLACQQANPAGTSLTPYRAVYKIVLDSARSGSPVADVGGSMLYEFRDVCDGWITEQRFQMRFLYAEGQQMDTTTNYSSWESKDSLSYRFNVNKTTNGAVEETLRGYAVMKGPGKGGEATYTLPEKKVIPLNAGVMLPTEHTLGLIEAAQRGESLFNRVVFDGSDDAGATEISAFILPATEDSSAQKDKGNPESPLAGQKRWMVRFAFFPVEGSEETPDYEAVSTLYQNGMWDNMVFDYGDFRVKAVLEKIEELPPTECR